MTTLVYIHSSSSHNTKSKLMCNSSSCGHKTKTKKCQPAARDTLDLIQTRCVPGRGLARHKNKNQQNEKQIKEKRNYFANVTLVSRETPTHIKQNQQKCQPAARDTLDLIQTMCVPGRGLARTKNKNKLNVKKKKTKRNYFANVTLSNNEVLSNPSKKTKKCQPAARDTQDLIQTWCVPDRGLARNKYKNKQNVKKKTNKRNYFANVTLARKGKTTKLFSTTLGSIHPDGKWITGEYLPTNIRNNTTEMRQKSELKQAVTKLCQHLVSQPAARDNLRVRVCVPDSGLTKKVSSSKVTNLRSNSCCRMDGSCEWVEAVQSWTSTSGKLCQENTKLCQVGQPAVRDNSWRSCVPDSGLTEVIHNISVDLQKTLAVMLSCLVVCSLWAMSSKRRNKHAKSTNGNGRRQESNLKIISWNLGPRNWINKIDDICHLMSDFEPDIAVLSEANLYLSDEAHLVNIPNYEIVTSNDYKSNGLSRLVVLVRPNLNYRIMEEIMEDDIATIWMKLPRQGKKPFILGAAYREHKLLNRPGPNMSGNFQCERWDRIINQWQSIQGAGDIMMTGDLNLDHSNWDDQNHENSRMIEATKDKIETLGYAQMVRNPTRFWPNTRPSLIDHVWTNKPESVISCLNISRPVTDHNVIVTLVKLKGSVKTRAEVRVRKWGKLDKDEVSKMKFKKLTGVKST